MKTVMQGVELENPLQKKMFYLREVFFFKLILEELCYFCNKETRPTNFQLKLHSC